MNAIAENHGPVGADAVPAPWRRLLAEVRRQLHELAAHPARSVVLLPYAQLMSLAAGWWAAQYPDSFAPRFETTRTWAERVGWFTPGPTDLCFDHGRDLLTAAGLVEAAGHGSQRALLAGALVEQARTLAQVAASLPPTLRPDWAPRAAEVLPRASSGPFELEGLLARSAVAWAGNSAYATDVLFERHAGDALDALVIVEGLQPDLLVQNLAEHYVEKTVLLRLEDEAAAGQPALHACTDGADEAERAAACVLRHLEAGRAPVALVAGDRLLTRRISALLATRGVALRDETGWRLSTTQAAARLLAALRACAPGASTDAVLDWLKLAPAFDLAAVRALEQALRRRGVRGWAQALRLRGHEALQQQIEALRAPLAAPRPLCDWLAATRELLERCGLWPQLEEDEAGRAVIQALRLDDAGLAGWRDWPAAHRRVDLAEFTHWLGDALEGASFRPPHPPEAQVVVLPLAQLLGRSFAALVLPGADAEHLPAAPESAGPWSSAQRQALHLPTREDLQQAQAAAWALALRVPRVDLLWRRTNDQGEPLQASPLVRRLQLAAPPGGLPPAPDPRAVRAVAPEPTPRPQPSGAELPAQPISASDYERLRDCPYRFFALRQLGLRRHEELEAEVDKADWGSWLHAVLHHFHQALRKAPDADRPTLMEEAASKATEQVFDGALDPGEFMPFAAAWPALRDAYLDWLAGHEAEGHVFQLSEEWLDEQRGELQLKGRIDRIDHAADGTPLLIDYKTERQEKSKARVKPDSEDTQLPFYALLHGSDAPRAAYLNLAEREQPRLFELGELQQRSAALYEGMVSDLARIAAGEPLRALGEGSVCDWCEVRGLCRKDFWGAQ
ncbi:MAG TPA: PD-(D/E)XK nuclease family protein [Ottowia sp.]|uniref:PD-(D/E)XK nuclease family protein n=1 Tax=Ottowia sp. TaxID=1898956 RepID=UPI002CC538A3|nr:PD-(D/E)XK nuclease family protein [Ottowia sp.]HMN22724.1 PD-(D/E)XK nuclease family protein [Ottowia sp.]